MNGQQPESSPLADEFGVDLVRRPRPPASDGQLPYESTVTAPTVWVPHVYTESEMRALAERRAVSATALVFGLVGLAAAVFGVWGAPLSLMAVVLGFVGRNKEPLARVVWGWAIVAGVVGLLITVGWMIYSIQVAPGLGL
ncbi:hypothetical protein [Glaciibacter sp. 2TAF33]|uniref:hypothetical protein n=1 Tax=Glaciibacter sp. 2TAF33 TaxID=3233015 RepID=UPI003F8E2E09